jgi:hypothetical protein
VGGYPTLVKVRQLTEVSPLCQRPAHRHATIETAPDQRLLLCLDACFFGLTRGARGPSLVGDATA